MQRVRIFIGAVIGCVACVTSLAPLPAAAHGVPADLAFFGPFGTPTVQCLRTIGRAAQRCFRAVLAAERDCMDEQLAGQACDTAARDARVGAAKQAAENAVDMACLGGQLTELRFNSFDEVKSDVTRACGDQVDAVMSMAYGPALAAASPAVGVPLQRCLMDTAKSSQKLVDFALRLKSAVLDRMAVAYIGPSQKLAMVQTAETRVGAAGQALAVQMTQSCNGFTNAYGRDAAGFLAAVERRADCIIGNTYVQTALTCPTPVCGNGIKEAGEQCDDGNQIDNDRCSNMCTLNP